MHIFGKAAFSYEDVKQRLLQTFGKDTMSAKRVEAFHTAGKATFSHGGAKALLHTFGKMSTNIQHFKVGQCLESKPKNSKKERGLLHMTNTENKHYM